jgi:uncharacterized protein YfdQ (DUF2303 family)
MSDVGLKDVIDVAIKSAEPYVVHAGEQAIWLHTPSGAIQKVDISSDYMTPFRKTGSITVFDAASFNQIIADNSDAGNITIYFDRNPDNPSVVGVLNGNGKAGAGWSDFRVKIVFRPTPQWQKWKAIDGKMLPQLAFAEFIEDNIEDIADPSGAAMLEIATYLEAVRTVNFRSGVRLTSGVVQFRHDQDDQTKVGANTLDVPETIKLGIAPIFGLPSYSVPARFRYRLTEGKLSLGIKLQRVETMMAQIVEDVIAKIERGTNVSVLDGLPPS